MKSAVRAVFFICLKLILVPEGILTSTSPPPNPRTAFNTSEEEAPVYSPIKFPESSTLIIFLTSAAVEATT